MMKLVVLLCIVAAASASVIAPIGPLAYSGHLGYTAPLWTPSNYRGPLSLAPGQPANIIAADGRPLDTLDVNLDRSAHLTAKALEGSGVHLLKKRSVAVVAPISPLVAPAPLIARSPLIAPLSYVNPALAAPITYSAPLVHW